jgi:hypothetical protein
MTADDATLLATLPAWAFGFVLVMARIGGAITLLPGLASLRCRQCCEWASRSR